MLVDIEPNFVIAWHTHPGTEAAYTLEGDGRLQIKGEAAKMLKPGFSWLTPPDTPHTLKNGPQATTLFVTFTVQKGKPLSTPVPAPT